MKVPQEAVHEKMNRTDETRLARECSKLDVTVEQSLADEVLSFEEDQRPENAKSVTINELHASHIGKVAVSFHLSSPTLDPDAVTRAVNILPELVSVSPSTHGFWSLSSQGKVEGILETKDIKVRISPPAIETVPRIP